MESTWSQKYQEWKRRERVKIMEEFHEEDHFRKLAGRVEMRLVRKNEVLIKLWTPSMIIGLARFWSILEDKLLRNWEGDVIGSRATEGAQQNKVATDQGGEMSQVSIRQCGKVRPGG
jgi:hypothetical protein